MNYYNYLCKNKNKTLKRKVCQAPKHKKINTGSLSLSLPSLSLFLFFFGAFFPFFWTTAFIQFESTSLTEQNQQTTEVSP